MKKAVITAAIFFTALPAFAAQDIDSLITKYADQYGVSAQEMTQIVQCESDFNPTIQSQKTYDRDHPEWGVKKGQQELSFGLVQIHLPSHKEVTLSEALDLDFSLDFLASNIAAGNQSQWSCYHGS